MWKYAEYIGITKPEEIDKDSSFTHIYFRKNIQEEKIHDEDGNEVGTRWLYEENSIRKEDFDLYYDIFKSDKIVREHNTILTDLEELSINQEYKLTLIELGITE